MPRPACVNLPELALQVLFRRRPDWKQLPAAVVASGRPLARIEALNRPAAGAGIRRGMRYATALSLAADLRADTVSARDLTDAREEVQAVLADFSPEIERCSFDPEIFWVDTRGLLPLFNSRREWADRIKDRLSALGFHVNIAVGFSRFGTFTWAKRRKKVRVFDSPRQEREAAMETPLELLPFPPRILELTESLGLHTVGDFLTLPAEDIGRRLGREALEIYRFATNAENLPLQGVPLEEEPVVSVAPLVAIRSAEMLEHTVYRLLDELIELLTHRGESIRGLILTLEFEGGTAHTERITPAHPSRRIETLARLVHLRLESLTTSGGISRVTLEADRVALSYRQEELFVAEGGSDLSAGEKALATVRAELGNEAVAQARLFGEHRPEERFRFHPADRLRRPGGNAADSEAAGRNRHAPDSGMAAGRPPGRTPAGDGESPAADGKSPACEGRIPAGEVPRLVRRIRQGALPLPGPGGAAAASDGPFVLSGHWWRTDETDRRYYYLHLRDGGTAWVYFDGASGRWMQQGSVD
jgi:protein ImuB